MSNRKGVAAVEFALMLPLFLLLILGAMEIAAGLRVQMHLTAAAREGAYVAISDELPAPKLADVKAAVLTRLQVAGIPTGNVQVLLSADPSTVKVKDAIAVTVSIPYRDVSVVPAPKYFTANLTAIAYFPKQGVSYDR